MLLNISFSCFGLMPINAHGMGGSRKFWIYWTFFNVYFSSLFISPSLPNQNFGYTEFSINTELLPLLKWVIVYQSNNSVSLRWTAVATHAHMCDFQLPVITNLNSICSLKCPLVWYGRGHMLTLITTTASKGLTKQINW